MWLEGYHMQSWNRTHNRGQLFRLYNINLLLLSLPRWLNFIWKFPVTSGNTGLDLQELFLSKKLKLNGFSDSRWGISEVLSRAWRRQVSVVLLRGSVDLINLDQMGINCPLIENVINLVTWTIAIWLEYRMHYMILFYLVYKNVLEKGLWCFLYTFLLYLQNMIKKIFLYALIRTLLRLHILSSCISKIYLNLG